MSRLHPRIIKAELTFGEPRRLRCKAHLKWVAEKPCMVCGIEGISQAHHLTIAQPKARGLKAGDQWTVPLCVVCHASLHENGDERLWWSQHFKLPLAEARRLWTSPDNPRPMK